ncbi:toll/interleukin-1 receptor domain-containing protein [Algoriphagus halophytocola]|uniref:Toll/interleukin-1 receptor domain-containing protein n=1 Tax=Algoriphagus halophytocola TaxID=2991499 RepID=A0ABY6MJL5_9BACT|nr:MULTISPECIES: toll/interleukin-1 receptor domain-containing protein [unclassified Algoriphagus]UZD22612.1 toll/interleukin-1 receptor domain-containing protein [Algoriphagus sp. TR-M5]WBL43878.1 toll/interleukin-1 receptor domain-containing protein [Algoriphagus sp. TR-M9]
MPSNPQAVFISYAWGGESEGVANEIDQVVTSTGIHLIRDKRDLGFKGLIKEFMEKIGQGNAVILVISDKYLKSPNCMFELLEVQKNGDFLDRVFPVVLPDATIYKSTGIISYLKYWEDQIDELNQAIKDLDSFADTQGIREDIDLFTDIRAAIAKLASTLRNMNTLSIAEMRSKSFSPLLELLGKKVNPAPKPDPRPSSKYGKVLYHIPDTMQIQEWTRCIVRLAWNELLLEDNLQIPKDEKVIENIRLGKVMQVCIEEGRDEENFEISSLSSKEQLIFEDDYTEWLFDVKPKSEGVFTLVLRVTLLQIIEGFGERKKDIVLERNVTTKTFAPEALPSFDDSLEELIPEPALNTDHTKPRLRLTSKKPFRQAKSPDDNQPSPSAENFAHDNVLDEELAQPSSSAPIPNTASATPKKAKSTVRKIFPYAASVLAVGITSVLLLSEVNNSGQEVTETVGQQAPDEVIVDGIEQVESPSTGAPSSQAFPVKVLVAIHASDSDKSIADSDYLFYTSYESLDTLYLNSLNVQFYAEDEVNLPNDQEVEYLSAQEIISKLKADNFLK